MEMQTAPGGTIERSNVGSVQTYGIKDPSIVMQTLSSLYQNPRKIVVQEYISNGRDAHREIGKGDTPVQITLPTEIDPNLRIRDFGPGLDQERITNVFCWFGESTKRDSNGQTGGFGIGAKCGFAYASKSFMVTSIVEEEGQLVKYVYAAYLNEQEIPEFVMMSEEPTEDPVGVEVIIPIPEHDFYYIVQHVKEVTEYWNMAENSVRPIIKNDTIAYDNREPIMEGEGWILYNTEKNSWSGRNGKPFVILDGIQYPIPNEVYDGLDDDVKKITSLNISLLFNTGEIYPAANRENLKFNETVKTLICERLTECYNLIKQDMESQIVNSDNLYNANLKWKELDDHIGSRIVGSVNWNGYKVNGNTFQVHDNSYVYYYHREDFEKTGRLNTKKTGKIEWLDTETSILVFNNESTVRPSPLRIKSIFKTCTDVETIQVIQINSDESMDDVVERGFNHLDWKPITNWEKAKQKRSGKNDRVVTQCYEHSDVSYGPGKVGNWERTELDIGNDEGIYLTFYRGTNLEYFSDFNLKWIRKTFGIDIIGIPERYIKKAKKNDRMIHLNDWLKNKLNELIASIPYKTNLANEQCYFDTTEYKLGHNKNAFFNSEEFIEAMPKDSCFSQLMRLRKLVHRYMMNRKGTMRKLDNIERICTILQIGNPLNNNDYDSKLVKLYDECVRVINSIPLLSAIDYSFFTIDDKLTSPVRNLIIDTVKESI